MTTRKLPSKWDTPPRKGEFDYLLGEIRDEVARITPPPQEPPRRPRQRVVVNVEVVQRRPSSRPSQWCAAIVLWCIVIAILAVLISTTARADGMRYEHWQSTDGSHGEVRRQGRTTDWTSYGPRGEVRRCHRYYVGDQPYSTCQ